MTTKTAKFSFTEWVFNRNNYGSENYIILCGCENHKLTGAKVPRYQLPLLAEKLGFDDLMTKADFDSLHHLALNKLGK
jgi:hypothetical protein